MVTDIILFCLEIKDETIKQMCWRIILTVVP